MIGTSLLAAGLLLKGTLAQTSPRPDNEGWLSPVYEPLYQAPLPIPEAKRPLKVFQNPVSGGDIFYFEVELKESTKNGYPDLPRPQIKGYDGTVPGPSFLVPRNTETIVRFVNHLDQENAVHLHGSYSRAPWDGWAEDITQPGEFKDYYYPNQQAARTLWYHDHAVHATAAHVYGGQAGIYIIQDPEEQERLQLPSGYGEYDIPLIIQANQYDEDGQLFFDQGTRAFWGDVIEVNGQPWPFFEVEPRKYRFRLLNAAVSRNFALSLQQPAFGNSTIPFQVIGSDAGLLEVPVETENVYLPVAERWEIVIDFSDYFGQQIDLKNAPGAGGIGTERNYEHTGEVLRFSVTKPLLRPDDSRVPDPLREVPFPRSDAQERRHFRFFRNESEVWLINGVGFSDVENRVLARPERGAVEIWELENNSTGWTHPVHVHLVDFRVLSRNGIFSRPVEEYEEHGLKDVVWLGQNETVVLEAHFAPWEGVYMFHCHNLIHEDGDMLAAFNVSLLEDFGYEETTHFIDPMEAPYQAESSDAGFETRTGPFSDEAIREKVRFLAELNPYSDIQEVRAALDEYWLERLGESKRSLPAAPVPRYRRSQI